MKEEDTDSAKPLLLSVSERARTDIVLRTPHGDSTFPIHCAECNGAMEFMPVTCSDTPWVRCLKCHRTTQVAYNGTVIL